MTIIRRECSTTMFAGREEKCRGSHVQTYSLAQGRCWMPMKGSMALRKEREKVRHQRGRGDLSSSSNLGGSGPPTPNYPKNHVKK